jgi:transposase
MGFLGLVPKEETTGSSRKLGSITKAGNAQVT